MKRHLAAFLVALAVVGAGQKASAHMIETDYNLLEQALEFTSTFSTGEPVPEAQVTIYAPGNSDEPWGELETDENGQFSFVPDESIPGDWEVRIEKDLGHGDIWTVPVNQTGVDYDNISIGHDDSSLLAIKNPSAVAGLLGLGLLMGAVTYTSRKS